MIKPFWSWFWTGAGASKSGVRLLFGWKIAIHAAISTMLLIFMKSSPFDFASKALFPAASILVSMAVAWTSRAATVLQDKEFRKQAITSANPLEAYVYGYQLALLVIITMVVYVSIMAGGGLSFIIVNTTFSTALSGFWLYFLLSFAVGQCWEVIDFSNMLTLLNEHIRRQ